MKRKSIGIFLVLTAAISWGVSGSVAQYLFTEKHFSTGWLVSIRLLTSGVILLSYLGLTKNKDIWNIWKRRASVGNILIFGLLGMAGVQFTYFAAIETSNAATATLLQYLAPVLIILYIALKRRTIPPFQHVIGIITALLGTYFLVSAGHFSTISIRPEALAWGLSSAFFLALYTLQPAQLLKEFGSTIVVAWGMIIGGLGMSFVSPPWETGDGVFSFSSILAIVFVILIGTLVAFFCYLESLKHLEAAETSLLSCAEPLSAAFLAVIWLKVPFSVYEWIGAFFILTTILLLSLKRKSPERKLAEKTM
ncbi:EamA family transporter [Cytobacillus oceanisediminis]|uniref:EamA family transporter n=1 Tax=Bacillaceae TaxID=186817 RepID=UPI001CCD865E|nr:MULTISPECIES: EamA family transporter [Bacillaceae]MBZ9535393.1 EamA family transporter [Cytobacillus oceanisediminis]UTI43038.1 EamA family transporter [Niallia sp. RD1]